MLVGENVFKRLIVFLLLLTFGLLLLYMDYLQEVNFYQNKLQLSEFRVNFETYRVLESSVILTPNRIKHLKPKQADKHVSLTNADAESFILEPPYPEIDLTYIGPVFIENGYIHLYCEYSFGDIRCTVGGKIVPSKIYFETTYFTNPRFEHIAINFELMNGSNIAGDSNNNWMERMIIEPNKDVIELFTNYIMIFGANGTNIQSLLKNEVILQENGSEHNYYKFIHSQISVLLVLIFLKILNFVLFGGNMLVHFILHIPVYYFKTCGSENTKKDIDELDTSSFKTWFSHSKLRKEVTPMDDAEMILDHDHSYNETSTAESSLRLRQPLSEWRKNAVELPPPQKALAINGSGENYSPFSLSTGINSMYLYKDPNNFNKIQDLEKQISIDESTHDVGLGRRKKLKVTLTVKEMVFEYYCFIYLLESIGVLLHLLAYEIINSIIYNLIASVFLTIETSDPKYLHIERKSIFDIPNILLTGGHISDNDVAAPSAHTSSNMLFNAILNLFGCLLNSGFALFFHSIYTFLIYRYTITMY